MENEEKLEQEELEKDTEEAAEEATEETVNEETARESAESETAEEENGKKPKERKLKWAKKAAKEEKEPEPDPLAEANDRYARLFAEFDNFRKRSEKEKSQMFTMGAKDVIEKMLNVLDSFERGLAMVPEEEKESPFVVGMDKVYKQFLKTLEDMGVKPIEAVGKEFNPDFHNAVMHVDDESVGENIIVEEFQKGYTYKDHVVRFSMVKVAN